MKYKCDYNLIKGHDTDSGYDLKTTRPFKLLPNQVKLIPTSLFLELDKNIEAQVRPKSSISAKGILVHFGTVDSDYRGEVKVVMQNLNQHGVEFEAGQKIAQIVFNKKTEVFLEQTNNIENNTQRGSGGFGSTGAF
ncbi:dUTP diphosphatase [Parvimonas sp. G1641]|uniref:dUTP diphosphatase n=1 Tax=Parvimonas sp. G1641 TaxID=3388846 RepID=UPI0039802C46